MTFSSGMGGKTFSTVTKGPKETERLYKTESDIIKVLRTEPLAPGQRKDTPETKKMEEEIVAALTKKATNRQGKRATLSQINRMNKTLMRRLEKSKKPG